MKNLFSKFKLVIAVFSSCLIMISCQKQVDYAPQMQALTNSVNSLQAELNSSILALQKSRDSLTRALANTNSNVVVLNTRMDSVKTALLDINSRLAVLTLRIDSANMQIVALNTQMATSNSNTASLNAQITIINNNIANFITSINILTQQYNTLIIILTGIQAQLNVSPNTLTNGLIAWYPFTGNAIDSSGNGNNGTVVGASLTTDRFNNANSAYSFNGSSNSIRVANNNLPLTGNFSISCWAKINSLIPSYYDEAILSQWDDRSNKKFLFGYRCDNPQGQSGFTLYLASSTTEYGNYQINWNKNSVWNQIVATYEQGVISKIYINGTMSYSTTNVPSSLTNPNSNVTPIEIGHAHGQYGDLWFNGILDEIRIYNRVLTQNEITYLASH